MLLVLILALTPTQIEQAIAHGQEMTSHEYAMRDSQGAFGLFSTPFSRVAGKAFQAKAKYEPFGPDDVDDALVEDELRVSVISMSIYQPQKIVIVDLDTGRIFQPEAQAPGESGLSMVGDFPMEALVANGEVRAVYAPGVERRWRFHARDVR